ncbi:MAG: hypothetical protein OXU29_01420 [Gammaproteobacteria bacterium]|nr:hypothetical protein [Gammaproteobacteria bacterium]
MNHNTHENYRKCVEIGQEILGILISRAKIGDAARINTRNFVAETRKTISLDITWEEVALLLKPIEHYCAYRNLPLLSALVVRSLSDSNISFPEKLFGQDIFPWWKYPLTQSQKNWYRTYWPKVVREWQEASVDEEKTGFHEWLEDRVEWFEWPSHWALPGRRGLPPLESPAEGVLRAYGYHVGKTKGRPFDVRKKALDLIFHDELSRVSDDSYRTQFDAPQSPNRLKKMANVLAALARLYSGSVTRDYSVAIGHYIQDLKYLYDRYYVGKFGFHEKHGGFVWPDTSNIKTDRTKTTPVQPTQQHHGRGDGESLQPIESESTAKPASPEKPDGSEVSPAERPEPPTTPVGDGGVPSAPPESTPPGSGDTIPLCPGTPPPSSPMLKRFFRWLRKVVNSILGRCA